MQRVHEILLSTQQYIFLDVQPIKSLIMLEIYTAVSVDSNTAEISADKMYLTTHLSTFLDCQ